MQREVLADLRATVAFLLTLAHLNLVTAPVGWRRPSAAGEPLRARMAAVDSPAANTPPEVDARAPRSNASPPPWRTLSAVAPGLPSAPGFSPAWSNRSARGTVQSVAGSYGTLVASVTRDADGLVNDIVYGDAASTTTGFSYDNRRRLSSVTTYRGPPAVWTTGSGSYTQNPPPSDTSQQTFQLLLQDDQYAYDTVDNPTEIHDWRIADEWPAGAKPVTRKIQYDDLYRVTQVDYQYASGDDTWTDPFAAEDTGTDVDPRRAQPSPHVAFDKRVQRQTFQYDWLGNTSRTDDDAHGFYDRSLGEITNGTAIGKPYQLTGASNTSVAPGGARTGSLSATYDDAGNLTGLTVQRGGPCLPTGAGCSQTYAYDWDEVGRLVEAKRWDTATPGVNDPAAADLRYAYDANDARVLKTAVDGALNERHTLYVFATLELRRAAWDSGAEAYTHDEMTEVPYLMAHGVRVARVVYEPSDKGAPEIGASGGHTHVFFELGDHLGSTSTVLDKATGELVEKGAYQAYGGAESDYRAGRWKGFREDYRFTGKEGDEEVGLTYFGARYYAPLLGRWVSADPLSVHGAGADLNGYAYVRGAILRAIDPVGLADSAPGPLPTDTPPAKPGMTGRGYTFGPGGSAATFTPRGSTAPAPRSSSQSTPSYNLPSFLQDVANGRDPVVGGSNDGNAPGGAGTSSTSGCAGSECAGGGRQTQWSAGDSIAAGAGMLTGAAGADRENGVTGGVPGGTGPKSNAGTTGQVLWAVVQVVGHKIGEAVAGALMKAGAALGKAVAVVAARSEAVVAGGRRIADPGRLLPERAGPTGNISPSEVAGRTPAQIDARARELGLAPRGPDPAGGRGSYVDPQTGQQRILSHPNASPPHGHVNNPAGQRIDMNGNVVPPESPAAHLPLGGGS